MKLVSRDYEPQTGITEEYWYDEMAGTITIKRFQDVEPILEANRIDFNSFSGKKPKFNDVDGIYKVATIPNMLLEKWLREEGFNWQTASEKERAAKLNSNEYQLLRTRPGRI